MASITEHQAVVVAGSVKSSVVGGVEFVVRCCEQLEKSVHIQHPGKYTQEELLRIRDQHLAEVAQEHANHEAAVEFLERAVVCSQQSEVSQANAKSTTETPRHGEEQAQANEDCGCGGGI